MHTALFTSENQSGRFFSRCRRWKRRRHSTFTSGKKSGRCVGDEMDCTQHVYVWEEERTVIYRDVVDGRKGLYSTFTSGKKVVSRDDVDGDSPILIHELPSAGSSDNVQTYELPDDYIITVWRRNEHGMNS